MKINPQAMRFRKCWISCNEDSRAWINRNRQVEKERNGRVESCSDLQSESHRP